MPNKTHDERSYLGSSIDSRYEIQESDVYGLSTAKAGSGGSRERKRRKSMRFVVIAAMLIAIAGIGIFFVLSVRNVLSSAQDISLVVSDAREHAEDHDYTSLRKDVAKIATQADALARETSSIPWVIGRVVPVVGNDLANVHAVASSASQLASAADTLFAVLEGDDRKGGSSSASEVLMAARDISSALDASVIETSTLSHGVSSSLNEIVDLCQQMLPKAASFAHILGGDGQPRTYLIMAQTNSEIRSTGGFAGSWGTITIEDGNLKMGEFSSRQGIPFYYNEVEQWFDDDEEAFLGTRVMGLSTSINMIPDFSHVGMIASNYWKMTDDQEVDGVIALDPVLLQSVLGVVGGVTTEDGLRVDGTNAAKMLLHDTYVLRKANSEQDELFAEVARLSFEQLVENIDSDSIGKLLEVFEQGIKDRRLIVWMSRAEEEMAVRAIGAAGEVPSKATSPQLGVYLNDYGWSKMSWWLDARTKVDKPVEAKDGSATYHVVTTLHNAMTQEEAESEPDVVLTHNVDQASSMSAQLDLVILLGPEDGEITDLTVDGTEVPEGFNEKWDQESHGTLYEKDAWQVIVDIPVQETVTLEYDVKVSPRAEEELEVRQTPAARTFE